MATPITWRNVDAPNPALAAAPLAAAGQSINNAFDIFSKVIQQRQGVDAANLAAVDEGGKQAYLDRLQQFRTPEEVAAFEASPEATAMRQSLMAATRGAIRPAAEARGAYLTGVVRGAEEFGWKKQGETRAQNVDARAAETAAQQAALAPFAQAQAGANVAATAQRIATEQQQALAAEQQIRESVQRIESAKLDKDRQQREVHTKDFERMNTAYQNTVSKLGESTKGVIGSPEGMKALTTSLSGVIKDPEALSEAVTLVTQALTSNPNFSRLPTDVVETLVLSKAKEYGKNPLWGGGSLDSTLLRYLNSGMSDALKTSADRMLAHETQRGALVDQAQRQKVLLGSAEALAYPEAAAAMAEQAAYAASQKKETAAVPPVADPRAALVANLAAAAEAGPRRPTPKVFNFEGKPSAAQARMASARDKLPELRAELDAARAHVAEEAKRGPLFEQAARSKMTQARIALSKAQEKAGVE